MRSRVFLSVGVLVVMLALICISYSRNRPVTNFASTTYSQRFIEVSRLANGDLVLFQDAPDGLPCATIDAKLVVKPVGLIQLPNWIARPQERSLMLSRDIQIDIVGSCAETIDIAQTLIFVKRRSKVLTGSSEFSKQAISFVQAADGMKSQSDTCVNIQFIRRVAVIISFVCLCGLCTFAGLLLARRQWISMARARRGLCVKCGYPRVQGTRCPECGTDWA